MTVIIVYLVVLHNGVGLLRLHGIGQCEAMFSVTFAFMPVWLKQDGTFSFNLRPVAVVFELSEGWRVKVKPGTWYSAA